MAKKAKKAARKTKKIAKATKRAVKAAVKAAPKNSGYSKRLDPKRSDALNERIKAGGDSTAGLAKEFGLTPQAVRIRKAKLLG